MMIFQTKPVLCFFAFLSFVVIACGKNQQPAKETTLPSAPVAGTEKPKPLQTGAERTQVYFPKLKGKNIAAVVNQTSMIGSAHLVDSLLSGGIFIKKIYAPEHGFRGDADAGEQIKDGLDTRTNLPVVSLYGSKKKPTASDLAGIDLILFDIQDVGARFYTYISSLAYLMEACAEHNVPVLVLDRPNPAGHYVDGPVLEKGFESFVGMHPVPVVHGMTIGEYARMVNGEGWLKNGVQCELEVIPCEQYDHTVFYDVPIKPSPNLSNMRAIYLYPSICYFEGTEVSLGRGTDMPFQVIGAPGYSKGDYEFTPVPTPGAKDPPHKNTLCRGHDLRKLPMADLKNRRTIDLSYLLDFYKNYEPKDKFFLKTLFFDKLAGTDKLRKQIMAGKSEEEIRASWAEGLVRFKTIRKKYLLYDDFE